MCGIVGIAFQTQTSGPASAEALTAGSESLRHRGPDSSGEWWSADGRVGFGHRRLAIIDLSAAADQPMHDGDLSIVFNGEIYNFADIRRELAGAGHIFRTQSDTEVILHAYRKWGKECLSRFNGMFAFAIYDAGKQQIFVARDRAGEKPLFYSCWSGVFRFGSELKALLADPTVLRKINPEALDCYLYMGFVPAPHCILEGIQKLPPAHALTFNLQSGQIRTWRYWQLPELDETAAGKVNEADLERELETLLENAVRSQLVSDVPLGILLSGGVDSSLVTAMAVRARSNVKTFTVRFPGYARYDETRHARLIAEHFHTDHVELEAVEPTVDLLPLLARQFDEPVLDSSAIPTFQLSRLIRQHCTVALGGDGGDELFGGYQHYSRLLWLQDRLRRIPSALPVRGVSRIANALLPVAFKGRNWLQSLQVDFERDVPLIATYFDVRMRRRLMRTSGSRWRAERIREERLPHKGDLLQRATRMDFENYLAEDILVKVDRASMLNSLEVRAPFLDHRLIEFAFSRVPSHLKATLSSRKIILKALTRRILPPEFDRNRKQGFSIPLASWLHREPLGPYFHDVLLSSQNSLFDHKVIRSLLNGRSNAVSNSERLFGLVMFELWRKEYGISL